jgi:hypothetical protein
MPIGTELEGFNNDAGDAVTLAITTDTLIGSTNVAIGTGFLVRKVAATIWVRVR